MSRAVIGAVLGLVVPIVFAGAAVGATPRMYHTVKSSLGYAVLVQTVGCEQTEVYVSSSVGQYAGRRGPAVKQGLTAVYVRVTDVCAVAVTAGGGGGAPVLFEADGQSPAALTVDPRLRWANVTADIPGTDQAGDRVTIALRASWVGTGELGHDPTHTHVRFPGEGVVSSTANDIGRDATASVAVRIAAQVDVQGSTTDALLQQTKSHCIEVPRPGVEGFYPCFGFPG